MYIIKGNENFQPALPIAVSLTKNSAEEFIKSLGFFRRGDIWVNTNGDDGGWLRIIPIDVVGSDNVEIAKYIEFLTGEINK